MRNDGGVTVPPCLFLSFLTALGMTSTRSSPMAEKKQADNWRSKLITAGVARAPNRAMLRAVGFGDNDFQKPIVGVANGYSNMNPCNAGIQVLADRAMAALSAAGAM